MIVLKDKLLFSVVNHGSGDKFVSLARNLGATGGTVFPVTGTASGALLNMLGLGDKTRDAVMILLKEKVADKIIEAAQQDPKLTGICALLASEEETEMNHSWKMITAIVNAGFADDIMDTARKAGATGGTITRARGTAPNTEDNKFLDITVVPEKEMVMIIAPADKTEDIVKAIKSMECLKTPGVGIIFTQPVKRFVNLSPEK